MDRNHPESQPWRSEDGRWWWDGVRWRPVERPPQAASGVPSTRGGLRPGQMVLGVVGTLLILGLVVAGALSSRPRPAHGPAQGQPVPAAGATPALAPPRSPGTEATPACQPPCAVHDGVVVTVANVTYDAPGEGWFEAPEAGNVYVTMSVEMANHGDREVNFNPFSFVLLDGKGIKHMVTSIRSCPLFQPVNVTRGADSGHKCIAFQASANAPRGLTLVWTPTFLGGDVDIALT